MSDEYLKTARKNGSKSDTTFSEAELIATHDGLRETFAELSAMRKRIIDDKTAAIAAIDDKYREELKEIEAQYAMLLSLAR